MQVHHINGDRRNNDLSNLQFLCPNCHSQTDNFCSKNRIKVEKQKCKICGKEISRITKHQLCAECTRNLERAKSKCPPKDELIQACKKYGTYSGVAKEYSVSDKTIRK